MKWRMQVQNKYEAKRREFELMFSLEDRMEDVQKAMLMEKLMDDYYLSEGLHHTDPINKFTYIHYARDFKKT